MEQVQIKTAQNVSIAYEVAGVGDRAIAALFDYGLLACYGIVAGLLLAGAPSEVQSLALGVLLGLPIFLYFLLCEVFMEGQSIGKRLRSIKVIRLDGTRPDLGSYLLRWMLRPIDIGLSSGAVAILTVLINGKGQRLGDLAAGTTVVKIRENQFERDTLFAPLDDTYTPTFRQAGTLTKEDIATAKDVLAVLNDGEGPSELGARMKSSLERKMGVTSELSPAPFLETVVRDYNHAQGHDGF